MARSGAKRHISFWRYYKEWVETYKHGDVRGVTYDKYLLVIRQLKKIAPKLMLDDMTRTDLQMIINKYGETHQKITVRDFYRHLESSLQDAVYEGWIPRDPCYKIRITSQVPSKKKIKWLEVDEVKKLVKIFEKDDTGYGDFFDFILRTGLRFAEALGVTPNDVDEDNMMLDINKTLNYKSAKHSGLEPGEFAPTKNKYSVRQIPIDAKAFEDLKRHTDGVETGESIWAHWFLQGNVRGDRQEIYNSVFNKELAVMCGAAGVHRISVHGLRHTHASLLIANHVSVQSVAKRLGHADTETTQRVYIHLLDALAAEDNKIITNVMSGL